ncbi:hypothetical protein NLX83_32725 [Allokutzneria sp. A3M-2-11 16]|uniref:hypothetical protein n=1 Tax=Allokutzneria sp. A3M-2-11 16 TaxID=2962043 RepID=UPI0020B6CBF3|nr:hypothetical protein [Allokutzneria sp. A3M-2-11 16]MCP3804046.1 hypothetical protein [Allokutzneria sp. A3M-2-11 16]
MVGTPVPPKGARATVHVAPNPTTQPGQRVTITGHCGGGTGLRAIASGVNGSAMLEEVTIIDPGPDRFVATARLRAGIGNGVGPIFVDCGGEIGVTLLVTHVDP